MPKGRLLILDDDPEVAKIVNLIGQASGLEGRLVADAAEFFRIADEWQPTHIALDWIMPQTDAGGVLLEMARRRFAARIIITSGGGQRLLDLVERTAIGYGLDIAGVLPKPFSCAQLRELLHGPTPIALDAEKVQILRPNGMNADVFMPAGAAREPRLGQEELHLRYRRKMR